jgi:hypothetical protein
MDRKVGITTNYQLAQSIVSFCQVLSDCDFRQRSMISIALLAVLASQALPDKQLTIASRVAGNGIPNCRSYQPDGNEGPCMPSFAVRRGSGVNATIFAGQIRFSTGALNRLNADEFALLAGHEIAHYYLGHKGSSKAAELAADQLGARLACDAGFDPLSGATVFRFARTGPTHPKREERGAAVISSGCASR